MTDSGQIYHALAYATRLLRLEADKSQEDVYKAAGLSRNVYSRLEDNERPFSAAQIVAVAAAHGLPGWQLMKNAEDALAAGEIRDLPASKRKWRQTFGFSE